MGYKLTLQKTSHTKEHSVWSVSALLAYYTLKDFENVNDDNYFFGTRTFLVFYNR